MRKGKRGNSLPRAKISKRAKVAKRESKVEEERNNPLDIPEILAIVASYISKVEDLKSVRLLNRTWRDETMKNWRNTAVFVLNKESRPVIVKAFDESPLMGLRGKTEKEKVEAEIDPFRFRKPPFKHYRSKNEPNVDGFEIYQVRINIIPHATYFEIHKG